jgi:hypothetical protein
MEKSIPVSAFAFETKDTTLNLSQLDSNSVKSWKTEFANHTASVKLLSDDFKADKELGFAESFKNKLFGIEAEEKADSLLGVSVGEVSKNEVSEFTQKLIVGSKPKFNYTMFSNTDGNLLYVLKYEAGKKGSEDAKSIEVWNIKPKKPSFLGMKIENLYNFFMIFVFMAGTASVILFLLSKRLLVMMNGVK